MNPIRGVAAGSAAAGATAGAVRGGGGGFRVPRGGASAPPAGVAAAAVDLAGLLALQGEADPGLADREARRHGEALLAELAELQRGLLAGDEGAAVRRLEDLLGRAPEAHDPGLGSVLAALRLRVRIELARRGR